MCVRECVSALVRVCVEGAVYMQCMRACVCVEGAVYMQTVFVCRNSADAGLLHPWDQQFAPSGESVTERGVNHVDTPIMPLLCPCGCINSAITEATGNGKVLYKTL